MVGQTFTPGDTVAHYLADQCYIWVSTIGISTGGRTGHWIAAAQSAAPRRTDIPRRRGDLGKEAALSATPGAPQDPACTAELLPAAARGGPVSHALSRVARLHRIAMGRVLKGAGLYPGQEHLMMRLWEAGPLRQSELIKAVDLDPSTVTKMLQRLEQTGHVRRCPDSADRRAVMVEATDDSCALNAEVTAAWTNLEEYTLAGLDTDERAELARLLAKVETNLCTETAGCPELAVTITADAAAGTGTGAGPGRGAEAQTEPQSGAPS